jgi:hypothetical protein
MNTAVEITALDTVILTYEYCTRPRAIVLNEFGDLFHVYWVMA